jgi:hypothetical protein
LWPAEARRNDDRGLRNRKRGGWEGESGSSESSERKRARVSNKSRETESEREAIEETLNAKSGGMRMLDSTVRCAY